MPDITPPDAESPADASSTPEAANAEMKSSDTGVLSAIRAQAETASAEQDEPAKEKQPDDDAPPADKGSDADSAAEHQDDEHKLEPWMRKRLARAEEKGRKQASAEILEVIKTLRPAELAKSAEPLPDTATPKTLADFDYDIEKFTQYQIREGVKQALAERDAENERRKAEQAAAEARRAFERRKAEFEARVGEGAWEEMISAQVDVPQEVVDLLMGHERDLDIAYYLVRHPKELAELKGKSRLDIAKRLASIDAKLSGSKATELPARQTKAPPPPPDLPSGTKAAKSIHEMSTQERIAEWRRQKASRR